MPELIACLISGLTKVFDVSDKSLIESKAEKIISSHMDILICLIQITYKE
jgi:hypothetical protein